LAGEGKSFKKTLKQVTVALDRAVNWRLFQTFAGRSPVLVRVLSSPTTGAMPHGWA
jgi:hypothetical protein